MKFILASGSKQRQGLLKMIGLKYEVVKSVVEEESKATDPAQYVMDLSRDKARSSASQLNEKAVILAADTVMYMDGKIYEKPKSKEEGAANLKAMSGKVVYMITGMTIKDLYQDKEIVFSDKTELHFKKISEEDINWYKENEKELLNCAGAVIQGKGSMFIEKVVGDYGTVLGISLNKVHDKLNELGYKMSDFELE